MGPLVFNSEWKWCEAGCQGGTQSQDARLCGAQESKTPGKQEPRSGPALPRLKAADTPRVRSTIEEVESPAVSTAEERPAGPEQLEDFVFAAGASERGCMYVPGRLGTRGVIYLIDTGCSHNLLSKSVFDRLPAVTRHQLVPLETAAAMADGSGLPIYGKITLPGRVRNMRFEEEFLVSRIADDAILGMVFLQSQECTLSCDKGILTMGTETVLCTDQRGNLLSNKVQVLAPTVIPPESELQVCCRLNSEPSGEVGLVENGLQQDTGLAVAATLCVPDCRRRLLVRCINVTGEPQELRSGTVIGLFQPVSQNQIVEHGQRTGWCRRFQGDEVPSTCPEHMRTLLEPSPEYLPE